jgi:hypothetical protein
MQGTVIKPSEAAGKGAPESLFELNHVALHLAMNSFRKGHLKV